MEVTGKVHLIGEEQVVGSAGTFKKRTIVIVTDEQYEQYIPIDFVQDKCSFLDKFKVGQEVNVSVNVRGNEYQGKFYVSLNGWRIKHDGEQSASPTQTAQPAGQVPDNVSDLPFN
jgi:single-strand DNA-binding protein